VGARSRRRQLPVTLELLDGVTADAGNALRAGASPFPERCAASGARRDHRDDFYAIGVKRGKSR
jgi:hypothetical protein